MIEFELRLSADEALAECRRRGLVVALERELVGKPGSRHWHLHKPRSSGTLELSARQGRVRLKIHPRRDSAWVRQLAEDLAGLR